MAIRRSKRDSNFTIISNTGMKDERLSFKAKGLLAYMLTLPDDWVFYESEIAKHSTDGKQAVRTGLKELQATGYLVKEQARNQNGKFSKVDWVVSDEPENVDITTIPPSTDLPHTDKPSTVKPPTDNQPLLSTNGTKDLSKQSTNKPSSAQLTEWFEKVWSYYPRKEGKAKANSVFVKEVKNAKNPEAMYKHIGKGVYNYAEMMKKEERERTKIKTGGVFFNNKSWEDEDIMNYQRPKKKVEEQMSVEEALRQKGGL